MHTEVLKYEANGLNMESVLYFDETKTGKRPAVLVFPRGVRLKRACEGKGATPSRIGLCNSGQRPVRRRERTLSTSGRGDGVCRPDDQRSVDKPSLCRSLS